MTAGPESTDDHAFLGGRLTLRQFRAGHRAGTDACLLAAAVDIQPGERVVDAGAGVGAAGLALLRRAPDATATLVERDGPTCALACHNIAANDLEGRAQAVEADLFRSDALREADLLGCADVVISNPPFYEAGTHRASPEPRRRQAHVLHGSDHGDWLRAIARLAGPRGRIAVIHRPDALQALLGAWPAGWGAIRVRAVQAHAERAATRILLVSRRGARARLAILPPLVLHGHDGRFTAEADAIHRGEGPSLLNERPV